MRWNNERMMNGYEKEKVHKGNMARVNKVGRRGKRVLTDEWR